jgi:hypothetical protein
MVEKEEVIAQIIEVFTGAQYPGDIYLLGSREGDEPYEEVEPFKGKTDWKTIEPEFLEQQAGALVFFSEGALRFYLPAYLVADLNEQLLSADPLFILTHGFSEVDTQIKLQGYVFQIRSGRSALVNPRRFGAMTFYDYNRFRLSVFTREEAGAITAYLRCRLGKAKTEFERRGIEAALDSFWLERAKSAPTHADLSEYIQQQADYLEAISSERD